MTLATTTDVEALLQGDIDPDDDPKIVAMLEMASDTIENALGRKAEAGVVITAEWHTVTGPTKSIALKRWPISSVEEVREAGTALTVDDDYTIDLEAGIIRRVISGIEATWATGFGVVEVDYTTGDVPGLRGICAAVVARTFRAGRAYATRPAGMEGLKQLTIGRWSATTEGAQSAQQAANPLELTAGELSAIRAQRDRSP